MFINSRLLAGHMYYTFHRNTACPNLRDAQLSNRTVLGPNGAVQRVHGVGPAKASPL